MSRRFAAQVLLLLLLAWPMAPAAGLAVAGDLSEARSLYDGLTPAEQQLAAANLQLALERRRSHSPETWASADGAAQGFVIPVRSFKIKSGHYCREFFESVSYGGIWRSAGATACRSRTGRWQLVTP